MKNPVLPMAAYFPAQNRVSVNVKLREAFYNQFSETLEKIEGLIRDRIVRMIGINNIRVSYALVLEMEKIEDE